MQNATGFVIMSYYTCMNSLYDARFVNRRSIDIESVSLKRRMIFPVFRIYVDDGRWMIPYMKDRAGHKGEVETVLQEMYDCMFRKSVQGVSTQMMEEEETTSEGFQWLQGDFEFKNRRMTVRYRSKNQENLKETGRPKTKTTQSYFSYSGSLKQRKYAAVMGKLHEVAAFSKPASGITLGVARVVPDFIDAQIPLSVVNSAVLRMRALSESNKGVWSRTQQLVTLMYRWLQPWTVLRVQQQRARAC